MRLQRILVVLAVCFGLAGCGETSYVAYRIAPGRWLAIDHGEGSNPEHAFHLTCPTEGLTIASWRRVKGLRNQGVSLVVYCGPKP